MLDLRPAAERCAIVAGCSPRGPIPAPVGMVRVPMPHNVGKIEPLLRDLEEAMALALPLEAATASGERVSSYGF